MKTNNKGFSLVELIVVIAIMAILAAVAIPTFAGFITKANKASDDQFLNDVEYAVQIANAGNPTFEAGAITVAVEDDDPYDVVNVKVTGTHSSLVPAIVKPLTISSTGVFKREKR